MPSTRSMERTSSRRNRARFGSNENVLDKDIVAIIINGGGNYEQNYERTDDNILRVSERRRHMKSWR